MCVDVDSHVGSQKYIIIHFQINKFHHQMAKKQTKRTSRQQAEDAAIKSQIERITELNNLPPKELEELTKFTDLPLSEPTQKGLKQSHFTKLTDIQRECILPALAKHDILAAAKTGSGKTLGFLVPLIDRLFLEKWTQLDGLGALVITPTRELALQIFEVLRSIGRNQTFSAGLLIGGKNVQAEKERVGRLNILVATPGRLLQHMDESPNFDANNLQLLILDEADRIMDMGFKKTMDAIVQNLPPQRQTMLFSATQTKNVSDLARLSLKKPKYISVVDPENPGAILGTAGGAGGSAPTPKNLEQFYTVVPLEDKLDILWSFLRTHTKNKILVFLSSSKQVRVVYESFRRMQPGIPLMHLHGRQKQTSRMETTTKFMRSRASCLLATDVVARGIDFPEIDWVIQLDCPEDVATYIHRVGRSARAGKNGKSLLMLTESEQPAFVAHLEARKIPITKIDINATKRSSIQSELQAQMFQDPELKYLAQKAFISYVRSVYLQKDKQVFNVEKIPLEALAKSFGLASAPNVKIRGNLSATKEVKNKPRALVERDPAQDDHKEVRTKYERIFQRQNQNVLSEHYQKLAAGAGEEEEEDDWMNIKRRDHDLDNDESEGEEDVAEEGEENDHEGPSSKREAKRALSQKQSKLAAGKSSTKLVFDDEGEAHPLYEFDTEADFQKQGLPAEQRQQFVEGEREAMEQRDADDKEVLRERRQEKKRRRKELERLAREGGDDSDGEEGGAMVARLPSDNESEAEDVDQSEPGSESESESEDERPSRPPQKKQKKQVQEDYEIDEPETLEDLEALSSRLLRS